MPTIPIKPVIVAVTRSPVNAVPSPGKPLSVDELKDWFNTWIKSLDPALLGVDPEKPVYVYYIDFKLLNQADPDPQVIAVDLPLEPPPGKPTDPPQEHVLVRDNSGPVANPCWITKLDIDLYATSVQVGLVQVCVRLPDMVDLEKSSNYVRNALVMGFSVKVKKKIGLESEPSMPFPVWLPPPVVGKPVWQTSVTIGSYDPQLGPSNEKYTNFLGKQVVEPGEEPLGGQVRWYSVEYIEKMYQEGGIQAFMDTLKFDFLNIDKSIMGQSKITGTSTLVLCLPKGIANTLGGLRKDGLPLDGDPWTDDSVTFNIPKKNGIEQAGFVVIWRDDIPSRVLSFVDVVGYVQDKIALLAGQLWDQTVNRQRVTLPIPVGLGDLMSVGVERLAGAANDFLDKYLRNKVVQVKFAFHLIQGGGPHPIDLCDEDGNGLIWGAFQDGYEPGQVGLSPKQVAFKCKPVCRAEPPAADELDSFSLQLSVEINVDGKVIWLEREIDLKFHVQLDLGLPIVFQPEPLVLPTLAIFFFHKIEVANDAFLIMLPAGTHLFGKDTNGNDREIHLDAQTPSEFNTIRTKITGELARILSALNLIKDLMPGMIDPAVLNLLSTAASIGYSVGTCVIDSNGEVNDLRNWIYNLRPWYLGGNQTFFRELSAVILIGPPHGISKTEIQCFEFPEFNTRNPAESQVGIAMTLGIPDGKLIAALPDFRDLSLACTEFPVSRPDMVISPAGTTNFNDRIVSIRFKTG
jgi:hypothetical protein